MAYKNKNKTKTNNKSKVDKDPKDKSMKKGKPRQGAKSPDKVDQKSYYPDYAQNLSLISRLRAGRSGTIVKVRHFEVGAVDVGTIDYLKSHITSAINTLATQRGYQSTVDFSVIEDYVDKLINLEIAAATFVRTQNLVKIEDILGNQVGEAFYKLSRDYMVDPDKFYISSHFEVASAKNKAVFAEAVTNHAYSTDFVSPMSKLLTTPHLHAQILAYFGVVHLDVQSDDDSVFNILWNEDTPISFAELKTLIDQVRTVILNYPDLELILRSIGFSSFEEIGEEFPRDRIQQSMTIRNDGFFNAMLHNSKVNIELIRITESSPASLVYVTNHSYPDTFLNDVSSIATVMDPTATGVSSVNKADYIALKMFATGMVYRNFNIVYKKTDGSIAKTYMKPIAAIDRWSAVPDTLGSPNGSGTGKINSGFISNLFNMYRDRDLMIPDDGTRFASLRHAAASGPDPASVYVVLETKSQGVLEQGNRLSVSDALDASLYLDNRKMFLLYGTVE